MTDSNYENWIPVFSTSTDYEADLVRDRLDDAGIPAVVLTQRDHAFNLTVGDLAEVNVLVQPNRVAEAQALLGSEPFSDAELEAAALSAAPAPDAHEEEEETMLDSGAESIRLSVPDEEDEDDEALQA